MEKTMGAMLVASDTRLLKVNVIAFSAKKAGLRVAAPS